MPCMLRSPRAPTPRSCAPTRRTRGRGLFSKLKVDPASAASLREGAAMAGGETAVLPPLVHWVTGLVPSNVVAAAADGAMLPLLVFAVLFGFAATRIPSNSRDLLVSFFRAVSEVMLVLVRWIMVLAPVGVFGLALPLEQQTRRAAR